MVFHISSNHVYNNATCSSNNFMFYPSCPHQVTNFDRETSLTRLVIFLSNIFSFFLFCSQIDISIQTGDLKSSTDAFIECFTTTNNLPVDNSFVRHQLRRLEKEEPELRRNVRAAMQVNIVLYMSR